MVVVAIFLQHLEQKPSIAVQQVPPVFLAPPVSSSLLHAFVTVGLTLCLLDGVDCWKISEITASQIFNSETLLDILLNFLKISMALGNYHSKVNQLRMFYCFDIVILTQNV